MNSKHSGRDRGLTADPVLAHVGELARFLRGILGRWPAPIIMRVLLARAGRASDAIEMPESDRPHFEHVLSSLLLLEQFLPRAIEELNRSGLPAARRTAKGVVQNVVFLCGRLGLVSNQEEFRALAGEDPKIVETSMGWVCQLQANLPSTRATTKEKQRNEAMALLLKATKKSAEKDDDCHEEHPQIAIVTNKCWQQCQRKRQKRKPAGTEPSGEAAA